MIALVLACLAAVAMAVAAACYAIGKQASQQALDALALAQAADRDRDRWRQDAKHWKDMAALNLCLARFWADMANTHGRPVKPSPVSHATPEELMPGPTAWEDEPGPESYGV